MQAGLYVRTRCKADIVEYIHARTLSFSFGIATLREILHAAYGCCYAIHKYGSLTSCGAVAMSETHRPRIGGVSLGSRLRQDRASRRAPGSDGRSCSSSVMLRRN